MTAIPRFKERDEWTTDEIVRHDRTGEKPENPAYTQRKIECLRADGFDTEADELEATASGQMPVDEMSSDQHLQRIQEANRR